MNFIKKKINDIKDVLLADTIRRTFACYKIGFFYILFVGNFLCPLATMMHTPQTLIWILTIVMGFLFGSFMISSPVFTKDQVFTISRYTTIISLVCSISLFLVIYFFHIHIKPL